MKQLIHTFINTFFRKELELRVKVFHILAMVGVCICVSMTIVSYIQHMPVSMAINVGTGILSLFLLIYSAKGGRQSFCYGATVVAIFLILFPSLFVFGGGYTGGMVFFFVFAVVYTVYMLDGWKMLAVTLFELLYYIGFCIFAYLCPGWITPFATPLDVLIDVIVGFAAVSISLGATMYAQFRLYQKQQQELEEARANAEVASRAKSNFLANMSHEIRTPIHVIMGINELIRHEAAEEKIREYGEKIQDAGEVLRGLVDNILDMSKIEAGKTEIHNSPYRTADLVRVLELTGQTRCQTKNLQFRCNRQDMLPVLCGDVAHIQQIAINLLSNGVKYTESGSLTLTLACKPTDISDTVLLCIVVADTGIGMTKEEIPLLFEAFARAKQPTNRYIEGTGLGLAIVKELCELMNGTIRVESQKGYGSTFTVEIPQTVASLDSMENGVEETGFVCPGGRVLVVDDNPENLSVMRELLHRTQLQVDTVSSGVAALKAVKKKSYHAVLLDYMMPDMDGVETLKQMRKLPGFDTPVIALTANAVAGTKESLLAEGFTEYLTKPIPWGRLYALLLSFLPEELVTVIPVSVPMQEEAALFCEEYQKHFTPYHIDLHAAMPFFEGNAREYIRTAGIFLSHGDDGQRTIAAFQHMEDPGDLLYAVHALKGRAKNLGILALAEEAERIEKRCREGEYTEAQSMIPHLLYLYQHAIEALALLSPKMEELHRTESSPADRQNVADCRRELPGYLDRLQRGPALACIEALLTMEPTDRERTMLTEMRKAVSAIQFDRAAAICTDYLEGGVGIWTSEAES